MRKLFLMCFLFVSIGSFLSCEKDDICTLGTPTTPNLIVSFYNSTNSTEVKNVENLLLIASDKNTGILYNAVSSIKIPLQTDKDQTTYRLLKNYKYEDGTFENEDILTINYKRDDIFISRSCGYSTVFTLNTTNGITIKTDASNWMLSSEILNSQIFIETNAHVKIFH